MWKIFLWDNKSIKLNQEIKAAYIWDVKIYPNTIGILNKETPYARWRLKKYWAWGVSDRAFAHYNHSLWTLWPIKSIWDVYWDLITPWGEKWTVEISNWRLYYPNLKDDWSTNRTFCFWIRLSWETTWEGQIFSSNAPWDPSWRIFWQSNSNSYYSSYNWFSWFRVIEWPKLETEKRYFITLAWEDFYIDWKRIWSLPSWSIAPWHLYVLWWQSSRWETPDPNTPRTPLNVSEYIIYKKTLSGAEINWIYNELKDLYK